MGGGGRDRGRGLGGSTPVPPGGRGGPTATGSRGGSVLPTATTGSRGGSGSTTATGRRGGSGSTTATGPRGDSGSTTATGPREGSGSTTATGPPPAQPQQRRPLPAQPQQFRPDRREQLTGFARAAATTACEAAKTAACEASTACEAAKTAACEALHSLMERQQITRLKEELETEEKRRVQAKKKAAEDAAREEITSSVLLLQIELHGAVNNPKKQHVGTGKHGHVYKSTMGQMTVAIKIPNESLQWKQEFKQEVDILKRIRHANLVTLIGACAEKHALVYEFLCNGTLEDRLAKKEHAGSFSWEERVRIASSICSALMFLHSSNPDPIIHGDLKPSNVLFDAEGTCKLGDFGMSRLLQQTSHTIPGQMMGILKGIYEVAMGVDHGSTESDVLAFGLILLQLVTGQAAKDLRKEVLRKLGDVKIFEQNNVERQREVLKKGQIVDAKLDKWATEDAAKMVLLGLRCSDPVRAQRPDLAADVWIQIESMKKDRGASHSQG